MTLRIALIFPLQFLLLTYSWRDLMDSYVFQINLRDCLKKIALASAWCDYQFALSTNLNKEKLSLAGIEHAQLFVRERRNVLTTWMVLTQHTHTNGKR